MAFDVRSARERLDLTTTALAADLQVPERTVRGWEEGTVPIPRSTRRQLEYLVAEKDWLAAMKACPVPRCAWIDRRSAILEHAGGDEMDEHLREMQGHCASCETCRARDAWAARLPRRPMPPGTGTLNLLARIGFGIDRLPKWARPAAASALALAALTSVRVLIVLPAALRSPLELLKAVGVVLLAGGAGAVGGLAYSLTRPKLEPLGLIGDYLTGIVCVSAYMAALIVVMPMAFGEPAIENTADLVVFAGCSVFFGLIVGHAWFYNHRPSRPRG